MRLSSTIDLNTVAEDTERATRSAAAAAEDAEDVILTRLEGAPREQEVAVTPLHEDFAAVQTADGHRIGRDVEGAAPAAHGGAVGAAQLARRRIRGKTKCARVAAIDGDEEQRGARRGDLDASSRSQVKTLKFPSSSSLSSSSSTPHATGAGCAATSNNAPLETRHRAAGPNAGAAAATCVNKVEL